MSSLIFDISKIDNIIMGGVNQDEYPDFVNARIDSADYDGCIMTEEELEILNWEYPEFVQEQAMQKFF